MTDWKTLSKATKLRKGDQVWYGRGEFGFYLKTAKVHSSNEKDHTTPYGSKKGQRMVWLWNPHKIGGGSGSTANVFIPKSKITKIRREK